MGLDASLYARTDEKPERTEIHYWRKNSSLHRLMEMIYRRKGGTEPDFNCIELPLSIADLRAIQRICRREKWYGWTKDEKVFRDAEARAADGTRISYDSWW